MKHNRLETILVILLTTVLSAGCSAAARDETPQAERLGYDETVQAGSGDIRLLDANLNLRRGETGSITIQGVPGATYSITAVYFKRKIPTTTYEAKKCGPNGRVTWQWTVSPDTGPGTYPITIAGQGRVLDIEYTVSE